MTQFAAAVYFIAVPVMSVATFIAYWLDKRQAGNGGRRVSEQTLHLMAFLGGWPGALIGQQQLRHKTQKASFRIVFWLLLFLHVAIVAVVAWTLLHYVGDASSVGSDAGSIRHGS